MVSHVTIEPAGAAHAGCEATFAVEYEETLVSGWRKRYKFTATQKKRGWIFSHWEWKTIGHSDGEVPIYVEYNPNSYDNPVEGEEGPYYLSREEIYFDYTQVPHYEIYGIYTQTITELKAVFRVPTNNRIIHGSNDLIVHGANGILHMA